MKRHSIKLIAAILAVLTITAVTVCITSATTALPTFELSSAAGAAGDEVTVTLSVLNNPGITALSVQIAYSDGDLELVSITDCGLFDDKISTSKLTSNPATVSWYASDSENKTDSGMLATMTFRIKEGASSSTITLSYDEDNVFDNSYDNVGFEIENGGVMVNGGQTEATEAVPTEAPTSAPTQPQEFRRILGDSDEDGVISILDATAIQRYLAGYKTNPNIGKEI